MAELTGSPKPRVAVVFGGRSSEHSVSCVTAGGVLAAIDRSRYDVVPVGIAADGRWLLVPDDPHLLGIQEDGRLPTVNDAVAGTPEAPQRVSLAERDGHPVLVRDGSGDPTGQAPKVIGRVDVVLPLLHGPFGEDGTLQGMLEMAGVRYVGSGVLASAVGMDKHYMKAVLMQQGLPVCRYVVIRPREWREDRAGVEAEVAQLGWPVFVKPARGGSSIGISRVDAAEDLAAAVDAAREHDPKVLVEEAVVGREVECAVLEGIDGAKPDASVIGEIRVEATHDFYDFQAKYSDASQVHLDVPAKIPPHTAEAARAMALATFEAVGCEGLARVDFFARDDGSLVVNELNTMPGFTPYSMFPALWAASGLSYPDLVDRLLMTALARPLGLR